MPDGAATATLADIYTTIPVRNTDPKSNLCFSTGPDTIEWGYAGIPDGSDIQEIPLAVWNTAAFRKQKAKGRLVEASLDDMDQASVAQRSADAAKASARQAEIDQAMAAGVTSAPIVISADDMARMIEGAAHNEAAEALAKAEDAQRLATAEAQERYANSRAPEADPMSLINGV